MLFLRQKKRNTLGVGTIKNFPERPYDSIRGRKITKIVLGTDHAGDISHTNHIFIDILRDV